MTPLKPSDISAYVEAIMEYESDTFSASGSGITEKEAAIVLHEVIERAWAHIDGVTLDSILFDIRNGSL